MEQTLGRNPTEDEVAEAVDMDLDDIKRSMNNVSRHVSMDAPLSMGEDTNLYDVILNDDAQNPEDGLIRESLKTEIERALKHLSDREAEIIRRFYGLGIYQPHSLDEIGVTFDLTRERVRQIKEKAILKLKSASRNKLLRNYLG